MDLVDLYSDADGEEMEELGVFGIKLPRMAGRVSVGGGGGVSARGRVSTPTKPKRPGGLFGAALRLRKPPVKRPTPSVSRAAPSRVLGARTPLSRFQQTIARLKKEKEEGKLVPRVRAVMARPKPVVELQKMGAPKPMVVKREMLSRAPISETCPAAYRQLAASAGLGGEPALTMLKSIKKAVDLANTRAVATSEHHAINNTKAFRKRVLKLLSAKERACR